MAATSYHLFDMALTLPIPLAWYYAGTAKNFGAQPTLVALPGRDVVVYRDQAGTLHAVQSHCPHMRSPLAKARVRGDKLVCSLHNWAFDTRGVCSVIPGARPHEIPAFACLDSFSVAEHMGHLFIHTAPGLGRTLPFFEGENPADFACARLRTITGGNQWFAATANAFDLAHFEYVHKRSLMIEPVMRAPHAEARAIKLDYEIRSNAAADRFLVKRYGRRAQLDYVVWHGNLIFATTRVGKFVNRMMVVVHPTAAGFEAKLFVHTPRSRSPLKWVARELSAFFSRRFFVQECEELEGVAIDLARLGPRDELIRDYLTWLQARASGLGAAAPVQGRQIAEHDEAGDACLGQVIPERGHDPFPMIGGQRTPVQARSEVMS